MARKLLNSNDKKLIEWIRKSIKKASENKKWSFEQEFIYHSPSSVLNALYMDKVKTRLPRVLEDDGQKQTLETGSLVVSGAIVEKSEREMAIESTLKALQENKMVYEIRYCFYRHHKTYISVQDAYSRRAYGVLGLSDFIYTTPGKFLKILECNA